MQRPLCVAVVALAAAAVVFARSERITALPPQAAEAAETREARARALLRAARPASPAPLFLVTDPNKDPDDLVVLILLRALRAEGFLDPRCLVTTLGDRATRRARAEFARAALDALDLGHVRVGVGRDYDIDVRDAAGRPDEAATAGRRRDHAVVLPQPFTVTAGADIWPDGVALLRRELERVPDGTAVVLVNAGMRDIAELLRTDAALVARKVARVVVMGGVLPGVDASGRILPDARAYNHATDQPAADAVYAHVQALRIPLVVVTREAAYAAAVPRWFYDRLADTGHPLGLLLREQQRASLEHLWRGIHGRDVPPALTPAWFLRTFTDVDPDSPGGEVVLAAAGRDGFDVVWGRVSKFNLYDPLALLAAAPGADALVFRATTPAGARGRVGVIGAHEVVDVALLADLLAGLGTEGVERERR